MTTQAPSTQLGMPLVFQDASIRVTIDLRVYRLAAVQKTAYRCAERCTAVFDVLNGSLLPVVFLFRPKTTEQEAVDAVRLFFQDLLDQELREQIGDETRAIRALLLAQAFSKTDLIRRD